MRFVRCPEVRGCPYVGGRNVVNACYDQLGAGSSFVLGRLSASQSVHYWRFHCICPLSKQLHTNTYVSLQVRGYVRTCSEAAH